MEQQINYQYAPIPKKLMYCLDRNCRSLLFALVDLCDYFKSNKFYRSNNDLQQDTDLSKNLVIATLDTLYQHGLVDVDCVGKGVGRETNVITLNINKFKEWEKYSFEEVRKNPELKINTVKYKGSGYKASYLKKNSVEASCYTTPQSSLQEGLQKVNTIEETKESVVTKESKEIEYKDNILSKDIKNDLQKVNTCIEEKKECTKEELKNIYLRCFGELMNNYPALNYSLLKTNNQDTFYDCYQDIVNELVIKIKNKSGREDINRKIVLDNFKGYLDYINYSYQ